MKEIVISTPSCQSTIYCGEGALEKQATKLDKSKLFVITDSNVFKLYKNLIAKYFGGVATYVIPAGEKSKNYSQLLKILQAMISANVTRSSTVVALGGGVVGDISGLAASLYMRGIRLVQIPTTLLSQVDSSVGGKTAVDFMGVKNIIGSFYQPHEVIVDPLFLSTLPLREVRCGLGEIVKYGALDKGIYAKLTANKGSLFSLDFQEEITYDCIAHKANVVKLDEKETNGLRKTLNLGHTTGHALELYYKRKSHGEFVLIGMYYELYIAEKLGVCERAYADELRGLILKVIKSIPAYDDIDKAASKAKYDKKNERASSISMVVPKDLGISREIKLPIEQYIALICECRDKIKNS